jgi:hypothetical protein
MIVCERTPISIQTQLIHRLQDLIVALDRRVPQAARAAEALIARDAATLKGRALERIAELEAESRVGCECEACA